MLHHLRRVRDWIRLGTEIQHLESLDDHLLADMGIPRETIAAAVRGRSQVKH